jgi:hypothetical protein
MAPKSLPPDPDQNALDVNWHRGGPWRIVAASDPATWSRPIVRGGPEVSDVRAPEFIAEAHRQSVAVAEGEREVDDQAFIDAISSSWEAEDEG